LVERSVSLMKDPGSNLGMDIFFVIDLWSNWLLNWRALMLNWFTLIVD
jgi:hypothetical protein